ncbi:MAG: metallophosphoesterase family protein [Anaerolineae bacterium]|nr:metallophosphoesterase family protein [Anaerolineae bacterium]
MRYALISDIHGNAIGLDAVLADIAEQGGVDGYLFLGDYVAIGTDPLGVLTRISQLQNAVFIRGNTDRYLYAGSFPPPTVEQAKENPELIRTIVEVHSGFAWTQGVLAHLRADQTNALHWLKWLASLPLDIRLTLPDGTRLLLVHARPGHDDGAEGLYAKSSDEDISKWFVGHDADLICVGHSHWQTERRINGVHVVNPGSVGNPKGSITAKYAILEAEKSGYQVHMRQVAFDAQAVLKQLDEVRHPAPAYIRLFYGEGFKGAN